MNKFFRLLVISRPFSWIIGPLIFFIGFYNNYSLDLFIDYRVIIQFLVLSVPFCLAGYGLNDIYDYNSDKINKRKGGIHGAVIEKSEFSLIIKAVWISAAIVLISSILTNNIWNIIIVLIVLGVGYVYSAPPRLKEKPPLDSISNAIFYWFGPFFLGYFFFDTPFWSITVHKVLFVGIVVMAVHMYTSIGDYDADKKSNVTTFAVKFGKRNTSGIAALLILIVILFSGINSFVLLVYMSIVLWLVIFSSFSKNIEKSSIFVSKIIFIGFIISSLIWLSIEIFI